MTVPSLLHSSGKTLCTLDLALSESSESQPQNVAREMLLGRLRTACMDGEPDFSRPNEEERLGGVARTCTSNSLLPVV
jgi:hypothetical protein